MADKTENERTKSFDLKWHNCTPRLENNIQSYPREMELDWQHILLQ